MVWLQTQLCAKLSSAPTPCANEKKFVCLINNMPCLVEVIRLSLRISHCPQTSYPGLRPSGLQVSRNLMVVDLVCRMDETASDGLLSLQTYVSLAISCLSKTSGGFFCSPKSFDSLPKFCNRRGVHVDLMKFTYILKLRAKHTQHLLQTSKSAFCPHSVFLSFVHFSQQVRIISLHAINRAVYLMVNGLDCLHVCTVHQWYLNTLLSN